VSDEPTGTQRRQHTGDRKRRRYFSRPRTCRFCTDKTIVIEYKSIKLLESFITEHGKIRPRRQTGNCAKHQRKVAVAVKRARHMALLPFVGERTY
jgi:small subunit ribosomal protein S18